MNSVKLPVVVFVILILIGGVSSSLSNINDGNVRAGKSPTYFQGGDRAFYEYHTIYNRLELLQYQRNFSASHYINQFPEDRDVIKNGGVDDILEGNPNHDVSPLFNGGPMNSSWPMYCHDARHTSRSPYSTANNPYVEKWRFTILNSDWIETSPVINRDGTIYFGAGSDLYALYPNGTLKWRNQIKEIIIGSSPAIDENGTIYIGTWDCALWAINPDGTVKWRRGGLGGSIASSPAIASDGTVYFGTMRDNGQIIAMDPNGNVKWQYFTGYMIVSSPAIGDGGTVYIGSGDHYIYAIYPNGTLRWRFQTGDDIHGDPSIAPDGNIYITSYDGYLYALYQNGTQRWKIRVGWGSQSNSAIAADGTIYIGGDKLYAVYPNGTMRWVFDLGPERWIGHSSPAISTDETIYVGVNIGDGRGGEILGVNPDGTEHWRNYIANFEIDSSPAISNDGTIYIGSLQDVCSYLHAFGRGPLLVDANGPYTGYYHIPLQFTGTIFGGIPPYICHWDFGDGQTSNDQNPTHKITPPLGILRPPSR